MLRVGVFEKSLLLFWVVGYHKVSESFVTVSEGRFQVKMNCREAGVHIPPRTIRDNAICIL